MSDLICIGARTHLWNLLNKSLEDMIALPDEDAAPALQGRMSAWDQVDTLHERSYSERGQIALEFEKRQLWQYVINPASGDPFNSFSAWATSGALGGRRVIFESKTDLKALADVPAEQLRGIRKSNLKILKGVSTATRQEPTVLEAAKNMEADEFLEKLERDYPDQHIETRTLMRFRPDRSKAEEIEEELTLTMRDNDCSRDEALWMWAVTRKVSRLVEEQDAVQE